jgi:hypothetical protein
MSRLAVGAWVLWGITVGAFGYFFVKGSTAPSTDNRRAIALSPAEKGLGPGGDEAPAQGGERGGGGAQ